MCECFAGLPWCARSQGDVPELALSEIIRRREPKFLGAYVRALPGDSRDLRILGRSLALAAQSGDPNATDFTRTPPLHEAAKHDLIEVVEELVLAGASLKLKDGSGQSALDVAIANKSARCVDFLTSEMAQMTTTSYTEGLTFISKIECFKFVRPNDHPRLAMAFTHRRYSKGEMVVRQGEQGDAFFVIESGSASVLVKRNSEEPKLVGTLGPGDHFGEEAVLKRRPRNAAIKVDSDFLEVKVLSSEAFQALELQNKLFIRRRAAVRQGDNVSMLELMGDGTDRSQVAKTPAEHKLVKEAMLANQNLSGVVEALDPQSLDQIVDRAFVVWVQPGTDVIKEGGIEADHFYIIEEGLFEVSKNDEKLCELRSGDSFGELALLIRTPRAATVRCIANAKIWALPRQELRNAMQAPLRKRLDGYVQLLRQVEIFNEVTEEQQRRVAEALVDMTFFSGETILREGEEGSSFYILYEGEVNVVMQGKVVKKLAADPSDTADKTAKFFGERALVRDEPRAASIVVTSSQANVLVLDRSNFLEVTAETSCSSPKFRRRRSSAAEADIVIEYKFEDLNEVGVLGSGTFGKVSLVKHEPTGQSLALKAISKGHIIKSNATKSIMNEKNILWMTDSPFTVRLAATFKRETYVYFLMEAALGGELFTLYQRLDLHGSVSHARFYVGCVLLAFEHLHRMHIIYRDLKPENLLLDREGYCKVTDFGLAKFVIGHTYTTCGTPDYFAPEMVAGTGHTVAVDWWTLGILICELVTGSTPFAADDVLHTFRRVSMGIEAIGLPRTKHWSNLVIRLCAKDPTQRLPMRPGGIWNVKKHLWFKEADFDWDDLQARQFSKIPYVPNVSEDLENFDGDAGDGPAEVPYKDPGTGWDKDFEVSRGPDFSKC